MADHNICLIDLGGLCIRYSLLNPDTIHYFGKYILNKPDISDVHDIAITPEYMMNNRWLVSEDEKSEAFLEFHCLMLATGNYIQRYNHALFHGVCFLWKDKSWILTAPSGTGKTTQMRLWNRQFRKELTVINGDKPVIQCRADRTIWACSSPWEGKEKIGTPGLCAPLGGIVILEQGLENTISRVSIQEAVYPLFREFVSYPETTDQIKMQGEILEKMLETVPVWKLVNKGDPESAELTYRTLLEYQEGQHA